MNDLDDLDDHEVERALGPLPAPPGPAVDRALQALQSALRRASAPSPDGGRYTLLREIGRGGMGVVWLARDEQLGRHVAIKQLTSEATMALSRFGREARAAARLSHDNAVEIFDFSLDTHPARIVMELVDGKTLRDHVDDIRPQGWRSVVQLYIQAAHGLAAAHAQGLVHRDFKPDNAMVDAAGVVKVLDFGLTVTVDAPHTAPLDTAVDTAPSPSTGTGMLLGTPPYMSPQQHRGMAADPSDDIYAVGVCLWEALYGQRPFRAASTEALLAEKLTGAPPPPRGSDVPLRVHEIVRRAVRPERELRWPSMDAFSQALEASIRPTRSRWLWFGGLMVVAVTIATAVDTRESDPCRGPIRSLASRWHTQRPTIDDAVAVRSLDAYVADWSARYSAACDGDLHVDRQARTCLVGELTQVFPEPKGRPDPDGIPSIDRCADPELARVQWPPRSDREDVQALESYAGPHLRLSVERDRPGPELTEMLERARLVDYGPTLARLLYLSARVDAGHPMDQRRAMLEEAVARADASGGDRMAMRAAAALAEAVHRLGGSPDEVDAWIDYAYSREQRLNGLDEANLQLASAHALVLLERDQVHEALEVAEHALEAAGGDDRGGFVTTLVGIAASAQTSLGRHRDAADMLARVVAAGRTHDIGDELMIDRLGNLGVALQRAGEADAAIEVFSEQLALLRSTQASVDDRPFHRVNIARGFALRPATRARAVELLRSVVAEQPVGSDIHARAAFSLGEALEHSGDLPGAKEAYHAARVSVALVFGPDSAYATDVDDRIAALGSP